MPTIFLVMLLSGFGLSACLSGPKGYVEYHTRSDPVTVVAGLSRGIEACWFGPGETAFAGLIYAPERNASNSRVLLVPKEDPGGLPQLVVEAGPGKRKTSVKLFGPLLNSPQGLRIQADVARWTRGNGGCT